MEWGHRSLDESVGEWPQMHKAQKLRHGPDPSRTSVLCRCEGPESASISHFDALDARLSPLASPSATSQLRLSYEKDAAALGFEVLERSCSSENIFE